MNGLLMICKIHYSGLSHRSCLLVLCKLASRLFESLTPTCRSVDLVRCVRQAPAACWLQAHQVKMYDFFGVQVLHALQRSGAVLVPASKQTTNATDQQAHLLTGSAPGPMQSRAPLGQHSQSMLLGATRQPCKKGQQVRTSPGKCCHNSSSAPSRALLPQQCARPARHSRAEQASAAPMAGQRL